MCIRDRFPADTQNGKDWAFLTTLKASGQDKNWTVAPIGGEMEPFQAEKWMQQQYEITLKALVDGHFSWIGPYCPALVEKQDKVYRDHCQELIQKMGYDFCLHTYHHKRTLRQGTPIQIFLTGANRGVAPFYYRWPVQLALLDHAGKILTAETDLDIRRWGPGEFKTLLSATTEKIPPGRYRLGIGVGDPRPQKPRLQVSNNQKLNQEHWQSISEIEITPKKGCIAA